MKKWFVSPLMGLFVFAAFAGGAWAAKAPETIFRANCGSCHGQKGEGIPGVAPALNHQALFDGTRVKEIGFGGSVRDFVRGTIASGPGGCYLSTDGEHWAELHLWPESETGPADYLHAYWMGRYYGWVNE